MKSIQFQKFIRVAHSVKEFYEILVFDYDGGRVVVWMEAETLCFLQVLVDEHMHMMLRVVDQAKGRHAAWFQAEIFVHPGLRGETQLALVQAMFQVVDIHLVHALEQHQIVFVAFVVSEKQVLTMGGVEFFPIVDGFLDGGDGRVKMDVEFDSQGFQGVNNFLLTFAHRVVYFC